MNNYWATMKTIVLAKPFQIQDIIQDSDVSLPLLCRLIDCVSSGYCNKIP